MTGRKQRNRRKPRPYRRNVAAILFNSKGQVLLAERNGFQDSWQFPQGGINTGETEEEAVMREIGEELGTTKARIVAKSKSLYRYDFPQRGRSHRGQEQRYFLLEFTGEDADLNLNVESPPEFSRFQWVNLEEFPFSKIFHLRREIYRRVLNEFRYKILGQEEPPAPAAPEPETTTPSQKAKPMQQIKRTPEAGQEARTIKLIVRGVLHTKDGILHLAHRSRFKNRRSDPYWLLPGGTLRPGESFEDALKREFSRLFNAEVEIGPLLLIRDFVDKSALEMTYAVRTRGDFSLENLSRAQFFQVEELKDKVAYPKELHPYYSVWAATDYQNATCLPPITLKPGRKENSPEEKTPASPDPESAGPEIAPAEAGRSTENEPTESE